MSQFRKLFMVLGFACVAGAGALWAQAVRDPGRKHQSGDEIAKAELEAVAPIAPVRFFVRSSHLQMGIRMSPKPEGGTKPQFLLKDETRTLLFDYRAGSGGESIPGPENLDRMWGNDRGVAALADYWSDSLRGRHPRANELSPENGVPLRVEGAALFRRGDEAALWVVTLAEDGQFVLHGAFGLFFAGCTGTPPGGDCSCTASGSGAECETWTDPATGRANARCTDSSGTSLCTAKGGRCGCKVQ
jgi:hypothetical protein